MEEYFDLAFSVGGMFGAALAGVFAYGARAARGAADKAKTEADTAKNAADAAKGGAVAAAAGAQATAKTLANWSALGALWTTVNDNLKPLDRLLRSLDGTDENDASHERDRELLVIRVRTNLNVVELIAVAVAEGVVDEKMMRRLYGDEARKQWYAASVALKKHEWLAGSVCRPDQLGTDGYWGHAHDLVEKKWKGNQS